MHKTKILKAVLVISLVTGVSAAVGAVLPLIDYLWTTFVSGKDTLTEAWINSAFTDVVDAAWFGLIISITFLWFGRNKFRQESIVEEPIPNKLTRGKWLLYMFPIISGLIIVIIVSWLIFEEYISDGSMLYAYMGGLIFFGGGTLFFTRDFLHEWLQARYAFVSGDTFRVGYQYLGERQYKLTETRFRKTKITHEQSGGSEPMWRVQFSRWRFAVLPLDWETSGEPVAAAI